MWLDDDENRLAEAHFPMLTDVYEYENQVLTRSWSAGVEHTFLSLYDIPFEVQQIILDTIERFVFGVHQNQLVRFMDGTQKKYVYAFLHRIYFDNVRYTGQIFQQVDDPDLSRLISMKKLAPPFSKVEVRFDVEDYGRLYSEEFHPGFKYICSIPCMNFTKQEVTFILTSAFLYLKPHTKALPCPYCSNTLEISRVQEIVISLGAIPHASNELSILCNCNYCSKRLNTISYAFRCRSGHGLCLKCIRLELNELNAIQAYLLSLRPSIPVEISSLISGYSLGLGLDDNDW